MHTCIHTYIHTYIRLYKQTYIDTYINRYMPKCIHTYIHTYKRLFVVQASYLRNTNIYIHIYTYIHTYIHTHPDGAPEAWRGPEREGDGRGVSHRDGFRNGLPRTQGQGGDALLHRCGIQGHGDGHRHTYIHTYIHKHFFNHPSEIYYYLLLLYTILHPHF